MRIALLALALAATTLLTALPAQAASSATARASGDIPIRTGPGSSYRVIGQLPDGSRGHLQPCTRESLWCLILVGDEPAGWVRGSYIVGSAAKLEVTPHRFLGFDPLDPIPNRHCRSGDDDSFFCD